MTQPNPTPGREDVTQRVLELLPVFLANRERKGIETYGMPLRTFNGRDALLDALDEILDALLYIMQALMERSYNDRGQEEGTL